MPEIKKIILNPEGLHARPAGILSKTASGFQSKIEIQFNQKTINAKSSMSIMTLGLAFNSEIIVKADGSDANEALAKISQLIDSKFQ